MTEIITTKKPKKQKTAQASARLVAHVYNGVPQPSSDAGVPLAVRFPSSGRWWKSFTSGPDGAVGFRK